MGQILVIDDNGVLDFLSKFPIQLSQVKVRTD